MRRRVLHAGGRRAQRQRRAREPHSVGVRRRRQPRGRTPGPEALRAPSRSTGCIGTELSLCHRAHYMSNQLYYFTSTNTCGSITDSVQVMVFGYAGKAFGDTTICLGDTTFIYANNGETYFWYPANSLSNPCNSSDKGGGNFKKLYKDSDVTKRNRNGQTSSGLYSLFIPMEWNYEGYIDSYGIPVFDTPKQAVQGPQGEDIYLGVISYWQNEVDGLKDDADALNEFYRQFPRTEEHAFRDETKNSIFNLVKIYEQIDYNEEMSRTLGITTGNFQWVNGVKDSQVIFYPDPKIKKVPNRLVTVASADVPLKGLDYLLEALSDLAKVYPDISLSIIGEQKKGGHTERLIKKLSLEGRVSFFSNLTQEELRKTYCEAEIAIIPSLYEGFGFAAIEAMACGTPVIASSRGALKECLGDYGIYIDPLNPDSIASAMEEVLLNVSLLNYSQNSGPINAKRFNWQNTASQIDSLLRNLVK